MPCALKTHQKSLVPCTAWTVRFQASRLPSPVQGQQPEAADGFHQQRSTVLLKEHPVQTAPHRAGNVPSHQPPFPEDDSSDEAGATGY